MVQHIKSIRKSSQISVIVGLLLALFFSTPIFADVPKPLIPKANGEQCVEETGFMRRNHMDLLMHRRDETMHNGIRTRKYSLQNCLTCHAVKDEQQKIVTIKDKRHFCRSCHTYVAVTIDCFDCHSSTPIAKNKNSGV